MSIPNSDFATEGAIRHFAKRRIYNQTKIEYGGISLKPPIQTALESKPATVDH